VTAAPHVAAFRNVAVEGLPDVHGLAEERQQVLWVLMAGKNHVRLESLTASEISDILRDSQGIDIPRQRVIGLLQREAGTVSRVRKKGKRYFKIMRAGEQEISSSTVSPLFIDPAKAFSATRKLADIICGLEGDLRYCDPYVGSRTLDFLADCKGAQSVKLLTVTIHNSAAFKADLAAFQKEHNHILDVRVLQHGHLHDRYIVHNRGMILLGASLKDVGKKQSFVVAVGSDVAQSVAISFDGHWQNAVVLT
jgi:hypothetical protein